MSTKAEIRKIIKERLNLEKDNLSKYSESICKKIIESEDFENANHIFCYAALPDEVDLTSAILKAFSCGKKVYLPKVITETSTMIFSEILENDFSQLSQGYCGIKEPEENPVNINQLAGKVLILTPGRAFTLDGKRLGRGKGFYDRFFSLITKQEITKMGVCFSQQIVEELPSDEFDVKMDMIIFQ